MLEWRHVQQHSRGIGSALRSRPRTFRKRSQPIRTRTVRVTSIWSGEPHWFLLLESLAAWPPDSLNNPAMCATFHNTFIREATEQVIARSNEVTLKSGYC